MKKVNEHSKQHESIEHKKNFDTLLKTNIALQKVALDLVKNNNDLIKRIDNLIALFEEASKHVSSGTEEEEIRNLALKLESLLQQNKDLAKALVLLEEYVRGRSMAGEFKPLPK